MKKIFNTDDFFMKINVKKIEKLRGKKVFWQHTWLYGFCAAIGCTPTVVGALGHTPHNNVDIQGADTTTVLSARRVASSVLVLSGSVQGETLYLNTVHRTAHRALRKTESPFVLHVITAEDATVDIPLEIAQALSRTHAEQHFITFARGDMGAIKTVRASHAGNPMTVVLPQGIETESPKPQIEAKALPIKKNTEPPQARWQGEEWVMTWDDATFPWAQVVHVDENNRKTVLTLNTGGGELRFPKNTLPQGGILEVSLSNGVNGSLFNFDM